MTLIDRFLPILADGRDVTRSYAELLPATEGRRYLLLAKDGPLMTVARIAPTSSKRTIPVAKKDTFRVVTRGSDGSMQTRDFDSCEPLQKTHTQIGVDDCSTDLALRGMPVFKGLIGPIPEGKSVVRYESPDVFETLTKEWGAPGPKRRRRSRAT